MGIRQKLNGSPVIGIAVAVVMLGIAVYVLAGFFGGGPSGKMYYSSDDGQTWFADSRDRIAPFDYNGSQAVRAYVFECNGEEFVGYLERFTAGAAESMRAAAAQAESEGAANVASPIALASSNPGALELKRPGDAEWISGGHFEAAAKIQDVICEDGTYPNIVRP